MTDLYLKPKEKPTQKEIVLNVLRAAGPKGYHSFQFVAARIPRVAARVAELKEEGYEIQSTPEVFNGTAKGVRYFLREEESAAPGAEGSRGLRDTPSVDSLGDESPLESQPSDKAPGVAPLFDLPPEEPKRGDYRDWDAAA